MNLDFGTSEIRMKEITKHQRFCEWKSEIYFLSFVYMTRNTPIKQK